MNPFKKAVTPSRRATRFTLPSANPAERPARTLAQQNAPPRAARETLNAIRMPAHWQPPGDLPGVPLSLECASAINAALNAEVERRVEWQMANGSPWNLGSPQGISRIPCP